MMEKGFGWGRLERGEDVEWKEKWVARFVLFVGSS